MRRLDAFIITLTVAVTVLVTLAMAGWYYASTAQSSWIGQMWNEMGGNGGEGGMMGGGSYGVASPYLWVLPVALIAIVVTAVLGVAFYLAYPELKYIRGKQCTPQNEGMKSNLTNSATPNTSTISDAAATTDLISSNSCEVLLKTMTPEEQKVINVLINHQGKYLQKYVVKEAGLSRLKTHRIIARFTQRGIVNVKEFGNTNEIQLSEWVIDGKFS